MTNNKGLPPLVIITGPTAVGKTELSVELAERTGGEIISADSMQVYKGFDIGSAKVTPGEMRGIKHYLIDELDPDEEFNVYEFQKRAGHYISEILSHGSIPIIAGGTGFYIQSVLYNVQFTDEECGTQIRRSLEEIAAQEGGAEKLYEMLKEADPESAQIIHKNNIKRVIRALEYYKQTGSRISSHNAQQHLNEPAYNFVYFVLNRERGEIYDRINKRVDLMIGSGLENEVRNLLDKGVSRDSLAMQGIGYKEMAAFIAGEISFDEAVYKIKLNTRHFAKRQLTWFRREKNVTWINYEDFESRDQMLDCMTDCLKNKNII